MAALFPQRMLINERMLHEIGWSDHDASLPWRKDFITRYPATTDELLEVLRGFRDLDPINNIPMIGSTTAGQDAVQWLFNAFIYNDVSNDEQRRLIHNNNVVGVAYTTEAWRDALRFMNQLVKEDLLSPLSFVLDSSQMHAMAAAGDNTTVGMAMVGGTSGTWRSVLGDARAIEYRGMPPVTGPNGVAYTTMQPPSIMPMWMITRDAVSPEGLFRLGDYMLSFESTMRSRYGVRGVHWNDFAGESALNENGFPILFTTSNYGRIWGTVQDIHWQFRNPGFMLTWMAGGWEPTDSANFWSSDGFLFHPDLMQSFAPANHVHGLQYTVEEFEQIGSVMLALETYVNESIVRFITGDLHIERDWERYLNQLDQIGLPFFLEVTQNAFDRMQ